MKSFQEAIKTVGDISATVSCLVQSIETEKQRARFGGPVEELSEDRAVLGRRVLERCSEHPFERIAINSNRDETVQWDENCCFIATEMVGDKLTQECRLS
jgi:hypothetical protein